MVRLVPPGPKQQPRPAPKGRTKKSQQPYYESEVKPTRADIQGTPPRRGIIDGPRPMPFYPARPALTLGEQQQAGILQSVPPNNQLLNTTLRGGERRLFPFPPQQDPYQQATTGIAQVDASGGQQGPTRLEQEQRITGDIKEDPSKYIQQLVGEQASTPTLAPGTSVAENLALQQETPETRQRDVSVFEGTAVSPTGVRADAERVTAEGVIPGAVGGVSQEATSVAEKDAAKVTTAQTSDGIDGALSATQAAQTDPNDPRAKVIAEEATSSMVGNLDAAQGSATLIDNPVQRQLQEGELISGVADAEKASKFTEQIQAAQTTPSKEATVKGQLENLMTDFEGGKTPPWAAGAMRAATAQMAARGLGASSMAGQAIIQATMESALPIAQMDAQTQAQFEAQNLSNRQQRAMLAAQQRAEFLGLEFNQQFQARVANASRIADVANMNMTAEQQVQLENSRAANTMDLANLSNDQAMVMAEASALANLDMANLSNAQQAAVQNAQNFLQMDMANLTNRQQAEMFKAQQRVQSLFTDTAAENASRQFNASSQQQTDQFFANLQQQVELNNAQRADAMTQFTASERNKMNAMNAQNLIGIREANAQRETAVSQFNAQLRDAREKFNVQNQLIIDQSNVEWRRNINTANTAAINAANQTDAANLLNISNFAMSSMWQQWRDEAQWDMQAGENAEDRASSLALAALERETELSLLDKKAKDKLNQLIGAIAVNIFK